MPIRKLTKNSQKVIQTVIEYETTHVPTIKRITGIRDMIIIQAIEFYNKSPYRVVKSLSVPNTYILINTELQWEFRFNVKDGKYNYSLNEMNLNALTFIKTIGF